MAAVGLGLVFVQLWHNGRQARAQRTAQLAERRHGREWEELWSRVGPWYLKVGTVEECLVRIRLWEEAPTTASEMDIDEGYGREQLPTLSDVWGAAAFHEEAGVLFNTKNIDQKHMIRYYSEELVGAFGLAWWWVHWQRENKLMATNTSAPADGETTLYAEWETMVRTILDRRKDLEVDEQPDLWILFVPGGKPGLVKQRRDRIWTRHESLSSDLSRPMSKLEELEEELRALPAVENDDDPAGRVVCVPPWGSSRAELQRVQALAHDLSVRFERMGGYKEIRAVADKLKG